jgi:hypothetical protein
MSKRLDPTRERLALLTNYKIGVGPDGKDRVFCSLCGKEMNRIHGGVWRPAPGCCRGASPSPTTPRR